MKKKEFDNTEKIKHNLLLSPRYLSIEQAKLITESYKKTAHSVPRIIKRAKAFSYTLKNLPINIDYDELIVGNRTLEPRTGVVFPESSVEWIAKEIDTLSSRPQDKFNVRKKDKKMFLEEILSYWKNNTLENVIRKTVGNEIQSISKVVKVNQTDHAQGHIIPNVKKWLTLGPEGIKKQAERWLTKVCSKKEKTFFESVIIVLSATQDFIERYGKLAQDMANNPGVTKQQKKRFFEIRRICYKLANNIPETFREAAQSLWFLFVFLQLESNASSFSPGRLDQYLYPYLIRDIKTGILTKTRAQLILNNLWLKFNTIVYMRNQESAKYFAGFPIGFNVCIGGQTKNKTVTENLLSYMCLEAQEKIGLPQPNLSARVCNNTSDKFLDNCARVIGKGSGMPQVFNDESIIPALVRQGIEKNDATDYAVVGCVELSTQGNYLGFSDAAMINLVKILELTLNNGHCILTKKRIGLKLGYLYDYKTYRELEKAFERQLDYFIKKAVRVCNIVDKIHSQVLPSPFLSSVIDDCLENGKDVTAGGAKYNYSGIQGIQIANIADSLAVIKKCVYEDKTTSGKALLKALQTNYQKDKTLRAYIINRVPKYGNDIDWVDNIGAKWAATPLADGGLSAMAGRDHNGPTALLKSVAKIDSKYGSNGTLLNMKFLPNIFKNEIDRTKFVNMLKGLVKLKIHHVQFNVVDKKSLIKAKQNPDEYKNLTIRVAGYTAYFTELAEDLQNEIIARTEFGDY